VRAVSTPRQPLKAVIDRHGELPASAQLLAEGEVIVITAERPKVEWPAWVRVLTLPGADARVDLVAALAALAQQGVNELHVEAGAKLHGALLAAGLVDELVLYLAPCLLGDPARGMFALAAPLEHLGDRIPLHIRSVEPVGHDWRVLARVAPREH
jgi:diaminohydroxyphosphoribosylaminopyrimidine deaminase/5-amino-6-(5-phosphoribosylamino)uracil reductase